MGTKVTISDFDTVDNSSFITSLNDAKDTLSDEFDNVLYRDGSFDMTGNLDMALNHIFNLPEPVLNGDPIRLQDVALLKDGTDAENPNYTFAVNTLSAGSDATLDVTGSYPNLTLTFGVPRGATGASGALSDGAYGDITVSGGGTVLSLTAGAVALADMAALPANTIIGNNTGGSAAPVALTVAQLQTMLGFSAYATLASPVFTGNPTAPTPAPPDNDTSIATTEYVQNVLASNFTRTIPVMAGAMLVRGSSGAGSGSTETSTNKINYLTLDFDPSTTEYAQFMIPMPKGWNEGTLTVQFLWRVASGTGSVVWGVQAVAISDDDLLDAAFGTAVTVTDAVTSTTDLMVSSYTGAMTVAGSPAAGDLVCFQVYRDATNGSDTLTTDAKLIGVRIQYTTDAKDDS